MEQISIIIPVYNVENYLIRCVESVLTQTFQNFKIFLVNDGSTDNSTKICDNYSLKDPEHIETIHQKNAGVSAARNTGVKHAAGEYLLFLDSDDWLEKNALEKMYEVAKKVQADITIFGICMIKKDGQSFCLKEEFSSNQILNAQNENNILFVSPSVVNKLYNRKFFMNTNIFFPPAAIGEDLQVMLKLIIQAKRIIYIEVPLYNYFYREESAMHSKSYKKNENLISVFDGLIDYYKKHNFYCKYQSELEFLAIRHLCIDASVRIIKINPDSILLNNINQWIIKNFPSCRKNKYLSKLSPKEKIIFILLSKRKFRLVHFIFYCKDSIASLIHKVICIKR